MEFETFTKFDTTTEMWTAVLAVKCDDGLWYVVTATTRRTKEELHDWADAAKRVLTESPPTKLN
jgi:hypothetical protein